MADDPKKHAKDQKGVTISGDYATDFCTALGVRIERLAPLAQHDGSK